MIRALSVVAAVCALSIAAPAYAEDDVEYCRVNWWGVGQCWHRPHRGPQLTFSGELGGAHMVEGGPFGFNSGTGSVTQWGPNWGLRLGVDFLSWIGVEGRYEGAYLSGNNSVPNVAYVMSGGEAVLRLTIPTPIVRPYFFGGIGYYSFDLQGSGLARTFSGLESWRGAGIPMGVGLEVPLSWHVSLAAEASFRFLLSESFSPLADREGADLTSFSGVMRFKL